MENCVKWCITQEVYATELLYLIVLQCTEVSVFLHSVYIKSDVNPTTNWCQ